jgi:hypothetical protein
MAVNQKNLNRVDLLGRLPTKKPKVIMAVVLVAVMAFMWVKVILGEKTSAAKGAALTSGTTASMTQSNGQPEIKLEYIKLPVVPGRNDILTKDIFTPQNWNAFDWGDDDNSENVEIVSPDDNGRQMHENNFRQIAERVPVDAISTDQSGRILAFIQDNVVSVGDKLTVEHNGYAYEFIVKEIRTEKVVLGWENCTVTLQMSQLQ